MMVETICFYLKKIGYCVIVSIYEVEIIRYVSDSKLSAHPILNRTDVLGLSLPLTPFPISFTFMCTPAILLLRSGPPPRGLELMRHFNDIHKMLGFLDPSPFPFFC